MKRADAPEFYMRSEQGTQATRDLIDFLRQVAANAGAEVELPTFEVRGLGVTYWRRGKRSGGAA